MCWRMVAAVMTGLLLLVSWAGMLLMDYAGRPRVMQMLRRWRTLLLLVGRMLHREETHQ